MPFGLTNALAILQHLMNNIIHKFLTDFVICYLDDILIFSKDLEEHEQHVCLVLQKLQDVGLYVKLEKLCIFHQPQVEFLGYIISNEGLMMDPKKIQAVTEWSTLKIVRDVQCFLGFANFYRIFIKNYSQVAAPLTRPTYKTSWSGDPKHKKLYKISRQHLLPLQFYFIRTSPSSFTWKLMARTLYRKQCCLKKEKGKGFTRLHSIPENFLP
jgi:hypothetical protein